MEKTLLLTGATGLLGSHVLKEMQESSWASSYDILAPSSTELDLTSPKDTEDYFNSHRPAIIIHLAAKVMGLRGNLDNQISSMHSNMNINQNLFMACTKHPPEKIFFAGTVASYSFPYETLPLSESGFLDGDVHAGEFGYAWAKRMGYPWLKMLSDEFGLSWTYGILTNLFGPNDRFVGPYTHVAPALIHRANETSKASPQKALRVWGNKNVTRDFMYAPDAAKAVLVTLEHASPTGMMVNIGTGQETSMGELAVLIASQFGLDFVEWDSEKPVGVSKRWLNVQLLESLGFKADPDKRSQIQETVSWYLSNQGTLR
jgi:GDP-L-fucose synthase